MIVVSRDVFCDGTAAGSCAQWTEGGASFTVAQARKRARRAGWRCVRRYGRLVDLCPRCVRELGLDGKEGGT